jgi:hypothetical protein
MPRASFTASFDLLDLQNVTLYCMSNIIMYCIVKFAISMHFLTIRLRAREEMIVAESEARINHHLVEIESE